MKGLFERSAKDLSVAEQEKLWLLILENVDLFSKGSDDLRQTGMC